MRRRKKIYSARTMAVLLTAAIMAGGAPAAALADAAAQSESGVTEKNRVIEKDGDFYYVDANGEEVKSSWIRVESDDWEKKAGTAWYYSGASGRLYSGGKKEIDNGIYFFDDDGIMLTGWQEYDDELYYLGKENEGRAYIGWHLVVPDEGEEDLMPEEDRGKTYGDREWFYFDAKGRAYRNAKKLIEGQYYAFDKNGVMLNQWVTGEPYAPDYEKSGEDVSSTAYYDKNSGSLRTGWLYTAAPEDTVEFSPESRSVLEKQQPILNEKIQELKGGIMQEPMLWQNQGGQLGDGGQLAIGASQRREEDRQELRNDTPVLQDALEKTFSRLTDENNGGGSAVARRVTDGGSQKSVFKESLLILGEIRKLPVQRTTETLLNASSGQAAEIGRIPVTEYQTRIEIGEVTTDKVSLSSNDSGETEAQTEQ